MSKKEGEKFDCQDETVVSRALWLFLYILSYKLLNMSVDLINDETAAHMPQKRKL